MLSKRMAAILGVALALLSTRAFGVSVDRGNITPEYAAKHKDEFRVETATRGGDIEFKITRFVAAGRCCSGEIVIRKASRTVVSCHVLPSEDKSRISYVFKVSADYVAESEFVLREGSWGAFMLIEPGSEKTLETKKVVYDDSCFHFPLRNFAKNEAEDSRQGWEKRGTGTSREPSFRDCPDCCGRTPQKWDCPLCPAD